MCFKDGDKKAKRHPPTRPCPAPFLGNVGGTTDGQVETSCMANRLEDNGQPVKIAHKGGTRRSNFISITTSLDQVSRDIDEEPSQDQVEDAVPAIAPPPKAHTKKGSTLSPFRGKVRKNWQRSVGSMQSHKSGSSKSRRKTDGSAPDRNQDAKMPDPKNPDPKPGHEAEALPSSPQFPAKEVRDKGKARATDGPADTGSTPPRKVIPPPTVLKPVTTRPMVEARRKRMSLPLPLEAYVFMWGTGRDDDEVPQPTRLVSLPTPTTEQPRQITPPRMMPRDRITPPQRRRQVSLEV